MENLQDTKKWINERLNYIGTNCDLAEKENKRAFDSLETALNCVIKVENEKKQANDSNTNLSR